MKKTFIVIFVVIVILLLLGAGAGLQNTRDRSSGYSLNLNLPEKTSALAAAAGMFRIGVAKAPITPTIEDTWVDANNNARYEPDEGDSFIDKNGNGKFDAYWLAGFQNNRPATGVHDDLWARAIVWDNGNLRVALVVLDAIGFFHDDVIAVRKLVAQNDWGIDHVIVSSTHVHEVPDLMGLWGPKFYKTGVNKEYCNFVQQQAAKAIGLAFESRRPAFIKLSRIDSTAKDLVRDSRPPRVLDDAIHIMQFCDAQSDSTFGILLNWGNHPETLASDNLLVTADFCHYWLDGIEKGIIYDGEVKRPGIGGTAIFANGAIGGLMTTLGVTVHDSWLNKDFKEASFDKARAQGYRLADLVLNAVEHGAWDTLKNPPLHLRAETFKFKVQNKLFLLGGYLGIFNRGFVGLNQMRSEVNLLTIGDAWILTIPGEINPELVNGGIEIPQGADFPNGIVETPSLREMMRGKYNFVIGLANDEVGYIMPKSHWDTKKPYTYGSKKGFYGEVNSLGSEAGPTLHRVVRKMLEGAKAVDN